MLLNSFVMVVKTGPGLVKVFGASCCNDAKGFTSRASNLKLKLLPTIVHIYHLMSEKAICYG